MSYANIHTTLNSVCLEKNDPGRKREYSGNPVSKISFITDVAIDLSKLVNFSKTDNSLYEGYNYIFTLDTGASASQICLIDEDRKIMNLANLNNEPEIYNSLVANGDISSLRRYVFLV